jgi:nitroreductase
LSMVEEMGLFEAIYTTRAIRRFKPDPVPDAVLRRILEAACQAPSGGNRQPWTFLFVRSNEGKHRLHDLILAGWRDQAEEARMAGSPEPGGSFLKLMHQQPLTNIPVLLFILSSDRADGVVRNEGPHNAIQNLLLAARAYGLGGVITFTHDHNEEAIRRELGVPDDRDIVALIPLGYPEGSPGQRHGPKRRKLLEEVAYEGRWGSPITI